MRVPLTLKLEFGMQVQDRRLTLHMTQAELAARIGVSRPEIANVEAGRSGVPAYRALLIALALGTTVEALFGGEKE